MCVVPLEVVSVLVEEYVSVVVELPVEVCVEVQLVVQKPHVLSHRCMEGQVGQKASSHAETMASQVVKQSSYFSQLVVV